tara:strand:- start:619 stop:759 length:141 start_codon:yes stop_codon:yes gene_type:complete
MDTKLEKTYKENPKKIQSSTNVLHGLNGNIKTEKSPQVTRVQLQLF